MGDYYADLLVGDNLIVETKAVRTLANEHAAQILGYLKGSRRQHGLLINFGSYKFQIRKFAWDNDLQRKGRGLLGCVLSVVSAACAFHKF